MHVQGNGDRGGDPFHTNEELALTDEGDRLPWLEGDEEPQQITVDTGRVLAFGLIGLLILLVILAGLWWALSDRSGNGVQPEGTTIEAPDAPYKTRPEDPGGREVAGTGDSSFRVAEGQVADGKIEDLEPASTPSAAPTRAAATEQKTPASEPADQGPAGIGVQVGAYSTNASAQAGWNELVRRHESLQGRSHRVVEGRVDNAVIYRLQAVAGDEDSADALCDQLKAEGGDCQVKR